ncbi:MAG: holo-ACP synthase [candidate division Zixibacteria bacterium]|nr:holo-ACP synthase [candidate division Zixibacteria bacterium]
MISSIGLDIVEVARIERDIKQYGDRFVSRILSRAELAAFDKRVDAAIFLAGRFAAKEAVIKALDRYFEDRPAFNVIEIINDAGGKPELRLPQEIQDRMGQAHCLLSITHEKNYAAAVAVFEEGQ